MRGRAWRRYKDYTKAKRKREIDIHCNWWPIKYKSFFNYEFLNNRKGMYDNLHQYSKNKIHCSCPMCSAKTRNKGHRRKRKNYAPAINYTMMDLRRQMVMDESERDYYEYPLD